MSDQLAIWHDKLERIVRQYGSDDDGSHDLAHLRRVLKNANLIADEVGEPVCRLTLLAAVWLHDLVSFEKNDPRRADASRFAAIKAKTLLEDEHFPPEKLEGVTHAIEAHAFSANTTPRTIEAMILQDADRLDALGLSALRACFMLAAERGGRFIMSTTFWRRNVRSMISTIRLIISRPRF